MVKNPSGGWSVRKYGSRRVSKTFLTQAETIKYAKNISDTQGSRLIIHHRDGKINSNKF